MNIICRIIGHDIQPIYHSKETNRPVEINATYMYTVPQLREMITLEERIYKGVYCTRCGLIQEQVK